MKIERTKIMFAALAVTLPAIFSFFIVFPFATLAAINCQGTCDITQCTCTIGDCSSGLFDVYSSSSCSGIPVYEYSFPTRSFLWYPPKTGTYYVQALCDDGSVKSSCTSITAKSSEGTSTSSSTTSSATTTTSTTGGGGGGDNTWLIIVAVLIIIAIIIFLIYRFFFSGRKRSKKTYEELYRKWGSKPR